MAKVDFQLVLQGGEEGHDTKRYAPGDPVKGLLIVTPDEDLNCKHLYLRLLWHTTGRGTQYKENVTELDLHQGKLAGGLPRSFNFDFTLPNQPWSFDGHYISVVWKIQAQVDVAWATDPQAEVSFVVRPSVPFNP